MLAPQSRHIVVPAKLQWLRVCPMTVQSWPVPVMEYGIVEVRVAPFFLLLLYVRGEVSPHRLCCAISSLPQNVRPLINSAASWGVISPCSTQEFTRVIAS